VERKVHVTASGRTLVTLIPGDGIGREVSDAARRVVEAAGAKVEWEERQAGASVFKQGIASGVPQETLESIRKTRVVLKGPLETPVGFGEKSANVTLRKLFETYGNIRPVREFPGVRTPYSGRGIDLVIVRENVEDLYAGIEHMETPGVAQCLKLISRKGSEKIIRLAFEVALAEGRKRVHCATKANIMKLTEGMMKRTFEAVAKEYPQVESQHIIVDNCAHQLVKKPEQFDVIVTTNMNGDILSDLTSALIGGLGFAPSANIGAEVAIFEAVHGSAPKYAGKNVINPTAMILSAALMLRHINEMAAAVAVEQGVLAALEDGVLTRDVVGDTGAVSTTAFTDAVIARLGRKPKQAMVREYRPLNLPTVSSDPDFVKPSRRRVVGLDVFVESTLPVEKLGASVTEIVAGTPVELKMVDSRGTKVYPSTGTITDTVDHFRCRLMQRAAAGDLTEAQVVDVLSRVGAKHRWMHVEKLNEFDGVPGYTKAQGED
jgi:isocitrate dehydrogenase